MTLLLESTIHLRLQLGVNILLSWFSFTFHTNLRPVDLSLTLDNEISPFGVKTCLIEPGYFRTNLLTGGESIMLPSTTIEEYRKINESVKEFLAQRDGKQLGDPKRGAAVMYDVLTSTGVAAGREVPKTLALGSDTVELVTRENNEFNKRLAEWASVSSSTDFPPSERFY